MFQDFYFNLTQQFKQINFQIVNVDEYELFRDYTSTQFNYPFIKRNTIVDSFDLYGSIVSYDSKTNDYNFDQIEVNYQISQVCMEDPFYSDIDIYNKISTEYEGYKQLLDINSQSDDFNCNPNNLFWQKIKQSSSETN